MGDIMYTSPTLDVFARQFGDASFTACIENKLREKWKPEKIDMAIRGTLAEFPEEFRDEIHTYLESYVQKWFDPSMPRHDMRIVFAATINDLRENAPKPEGEYWTDIQLIAMFNIMTMKVTIAAYTQKNLRKTWGIRKPWF